MDIQEVSLWVQACYASLLLSAPQHNIVPSGHDRTHELVAMYSLYSKSVVDDQARTDVTILLLLLMKCVPRKKHDTYMGRLIGIYDGFYIFRTCK